MDPSHCDSPSVWRLSAPMLGRMRQDGPQDNAYPRRPTKRVRLPIGQEPAPSSPPCIILCRICDASASRLGKAYGPHKAEKSPRKSALPVFICVLSCSGSI
ncbi:hypothetical protein M426DRAFT_321001 [Hypoxylon sp. CI-4A]|nr:hypothetical protein M426DRAFT_321001 [Hypoxylon sp. CI-4A]